MSLKNLLFYRLLVFNTLGFCAVAVAYWMGFLQMIFERDASYITAMISGLFGFGLISTFWKGWKINSWTNYFRKERYTDEQSKRKIRKFPSDNLLIEQIGNWLVALGLIGNALAFFISVPLGGDNEALSAALRLAMPIAFGTTLWGSILMLWTYVNHHMLNVATQHLLEDIKE